MAVRAWATKDLRVSRNERLRTLVLVIVITCVPVLGVAIVSTTEPDLSDLTPIGQPPGQYELLNWFALRHGRFSSEAAVQALGYMVESDRSPQAGDWVRDFVLLPEAGNLLHPAHRIPDEMIAVRLREGEQIQSLPEGWCGYGERSERRLEIQPAFNPFIISIRLGHLPTNQTYRSISGERTIAHETFSVGEANATCIA